MIIITIIVYSQIFRGECKEHATNISNVDVEALRNLSSMFNSGKLKVSSLEVTGNIKGETLDITKNGTIGPTMIGALNGNNDYACISHKSHGLKAPNYALVQTIKGETFINSASNKGVNIQGNINMDNLNVKGKFNAKGSLTVDGGLDVKDSLTVDGNLDVKGITSTTAFKQKDNFGVKGYRFR